ncbi:hypothetical protein F5B21DRAFT_502969 [Xylaria acuta]|nr:hypothetical protein F5B21DRAFT_502969 [Xylaria acuta]
MATKEQQLQLGCEVAEFFTRRPGIEFVDFAGLGRHGGALLLEEKDDQGKLSRKLVIKYSLGALTSDRHSNADDDLRNEYRWLEMLRGAEHIVRLVPFADCSLNLPGISNGEDTIEDSLAKMSVTAEAQNNEGETSARGAKLTKEPLTVRKCPTFALEYLPNGTILQLVNRLVRHSRLIPNRMMWRIWLCMVRQCVAMAFPPQQSPENYSPERERFIPNSEFFTLTQNSSHMANFVFAEESPLFPDSDHDPGVPPVKCVVLGTIFFPFWQLLEHKIFFQGQDSIYKLLKPSRITLKIAMTDSECYRLIDFGRGRVENPTDYEKDELPNLYECGARLNLWGAASVMAELACPLADEEELESDHPHAYHYWKNNREHMVLTEAPPAVRQSAEMDIALRDTIARCMAAGLEDTPPLQEVLEEAEDQVANRGPDDDPYLEEQMDLEESDRYIRGFLQRFIFNASAR